MADITPVVSPPNIPDIGSTGVATLPTITAIFETYCMDEASITANSFLITGVSDGTTVGPDGLEVSFTHSTDTSTIQMSSTITGIVRGVSTIDRIDASTDTNISAYEVTIDAISSAQITIDANLMSLFEVGDVIIQESICKKITAVSGTLVWYIDNATTPFVVGPAYFRKMVYIPSTNQEAYRTKVSFVPFSPLTPNTRYTGLISSTIAQKSFGDPNPVATTVGYWPRTMGQYTGTSDTYTIAITTSGNTSAAEFTWSRASDSYTSSAIPVRYIQGKNIILDNGLIVDFDIYDKDSNLALYEAGDSWTVTAYAAQTLDNIFSWSFETGDGGVEEPDSDTSTYIDSVTIENIPVGEETDEITIEGITYNPNGSYLSVLYTDPPIHSFGVDPDISTITFVFNRDLDASTVTVDTITGLLESVDFRTTYTGVGSEFTIESGDIAVSGCKLILTLDL